MGEEGAAALPFTERHPPVIDTDGAITKASHDEGAVGVTGQACHAAVSTRGDVLGQNTGPPVGTLGVTPHPHSSRDPLCSHSRLGTCCCCLFCTREATKGLRDLRRPHGIESGHVHLQGSLAAVGPPAGRAGPRAGSPRSLPANTSGFGHQLNILASPFSLKRWSILGRGVPVSSLFTPFSSSKGLAVQLPTARLPAAPPGGCQCWRRAGGLTNAPLARQERAGDKQRPQEGRRAFVTFGGFAAALGTYEEETHVHGDRRRPASEGEQPRHHALSSARPGPQRAARGRGEG